MRSRPLLRRSRRLVLVSLLVLAAGAGRPARAAGPSPEADPIAGRWLGMAGSSQERVVVGLDFRRSEDGKLQLLLTQPIANYFESEVPGEVRREGDAVFFDSLALALTLKGDRLEGTFGGPDSPASFERAAELPAEAPIPDLPPGPEPRWQARLNGQVFASPALHDGIVYVGTTGGVFNAVRASDGRFRWIFEAGRPILGEALVTADAVFFVCDNGYLFKLDRAKGQELWRYDLGDARVDRVLPHPYAFAWDWQGPKPALADGVVFVGSGDGSFHAVDAASGERRWRFETGGKIRNGALLDGPRVVVGSADRHVYALDRETGALVWKHDTEAEVDAAPVAAGSAILIGNRGGGLFALDRATGARRWRSTFWGSWVEATPVVVDGIVYVGSSDLRRVSAIDPADGRVLWRTDVFGWTWGTPAVAGDVLYAGAAGGTPYYFHHVAGLAALDRATGRILWRRPLPEDPGGHQWGIGGSPIVAGDTLVVTTIEGSLFGFPIPWPPASGR